LICGASQHLIEGIIAAVIDSYLNQKIKTNWNSKK